VADLVEKTRQHRPAIALANNDPADEDRVRHGRTMVRGWDFVKREARAERLEHNTSVDIQNASLMLSSLIWKFLHE